LNFHQRCGKGKTAYRQWKKLPIDKDKVPEKRKQPKVSIVHPRNRAAWKVDEPKSGFKQPGFGQATEG